MRFRKTAITAGAVVVAAGMAVAAAPVALAYGPSYCNRSSCDLASGPNTSSIYFQMPQGTAESMMCWTDTQVYLGTPRWFKISTVYGTGYTNANEVSNQTSVGHC